MHILLTNDDGVEGQGLWALYHALRPLGRITVVAPAIEHSGGSHAITLHRPLRAKPLRHEGDTVGWKVDGTPVDCVKLALSQLMTDKPDLVVSGMNAGPNVGENLFYSGTVAAAIEGFIQHLPGVAFSLDTRRGRDFDAACAWAAEFLQELQPRRDDPFVVNVNVPGTAAKIKGVRVTGHSRSGFQEEYERRQDPKGDDYFWVKGYMHIEGEVDDSDAAALQHGYISVTPLQIDFTDIKRLRELRARWNGDRAGGQA